MEVTADGKPGSGFTKVTSAVVSAVSRQVKVGAGEMIRGCKVCQEHCKEKNGIWHVCQGGIEGGNFPHK